MKKVRFETCDNVHETPKMNEFECHFPRRFIEKQVGIENTEVYRGGTRVLPFSMDPVQRFESSNSSPYPMLNKTNLNDERSISKWSPSNDLELSILDSSSQEPRKPVFNKGAIYEAAVETEAMKILNRHDINPPQNVNHTTLTSVENFKHQPKDNSFFLTRGMLHNSHGHVNPISNQERKPIFDKENDPLLRKLEIMRIGIHNQSMSKDYHSVQVTNDCSCHHCQKQYKTVSNAIPEQMNRVIKPCQSNNEPNINYQCQCMIPPNCCNHYKQNFGKTHNICQSSSDFNCTPKNLVDKKGWAIERYEHRNNTDCKDVQKQTNVKEKREPTVSDLFKIIKLQNEQIQLLQDKVDKFISTNKVSNIPISSYATEHVDVESITKDHKVSIGVMTSFEMVRTATVINKEVVKCTHENAQIQCNRSQISIKEIVSKQPGNLNFLDGIAPVGTNIQAISEDNNSVHKHNTLENGGDEKILNEFSLYNVHVDNAITPLISPEQTLYLDVRDYSDSDTSDHSNVGWTYYNKVMTHVNGMLQDSDMPSSASALYRNTHQQCVQMQIDKANVSVTKRVKFGDDPLGIHQPHIYAPASDTSLKMNQLAAKYLKNGVTPSVPQPSVPAVKSSVPFDMSFATRNYMERHKLLHGVPTSTAPLPPPSGDIPRFLDITALKRQTKLL